MSTYTVAITSGAKFTYDSSGNYSSLYLQLAFNYGYNESQQKYYVDKVELQAKLSKALPASAAYFYFTIDSSSNTSVYSKGSNIGFQTNGIQYLPAVNYDARNLGTGWKTISSVSLLANISGDFSGTKSWAFARLSSDLYLHWRASPPTVSHYKYFSSSKQFSLSISSAKIKLTFDANGGSPEPADIDTLIGKTVSWPGTPTHENTPRSFNINFYKNEPDGSNTFVTSSQVSVSDSVVFDYWKSQQTDYHWHESSESFSRNHDFKAKYDTYYSSGACTCPAYPTINGYKCTGWYTAKSGGSLVGGDGGTSTREFSDSTNIYAQWDPDDHKATIKYFAKVKDEIVAIKDDEGNDGKEINTEYGKKYKAELPNIWGYSIPTYLLAPDDSQIALDQVSGDSDITYAAIYEPKINTITFMSNRDGAKIDGKTMSSINYTYTIYDGEIIESISEDKKVINIFGLYDVSCSIGSTTYCFLGWNTKKDGTGEYISYIMPTDKSSVPAWGATTVLYAQWLPLGRYIFKDNKWHGILNAWVYKNGKWQGWIPNVAEKDLIKSNTTVWSMVKDPETGKLSWKKEYGGDRI